MKNNILKKILAIMKFGFYGFLLQFVCFSLLTAGNGLAQQQSIYDVYLSVQIEDGRLIDAFEEIENKTGFKFSYNDNVVKENSIIRLNITSKSLGKVLGELSKKTNLKFKRINQNIHVSKIKLFERSVTEELSLEQNITIIGKVTSAEDETGLPGVNVIVKGTALGTVTDVEGNYSLDVPDESTILVFSSVGYTLKEVTVGSQTVIDIVMSPDLTALDEIVVIGYGTQKKSDLTGSVSSVSSDEITQLPTVNVASALQGRAAGVTVTENSGRPGSGSTVVIRGLGTVGNSKPLYVVDGQILNDGIGLESINPNDIQSIEVLKDASSSAIYGARAANGVVLITTQRGAEGKTKLSYNMYYGVQQTMDRTEWMSASEYVQNDIDLNKARGMVSPWEAEGDPSQWGQGINYWDKLWRTGSITDHSINLSGGNANSQFLVTFGYLNNKGVMIGQDFERFTVRINTDHQIGKWLKIGESLQISRGNQSAIGGTGAFNEVFLGATSMVPTIDPEKLEDGTWNGPTRLGEPNHFTVWNPRQKVAEWDWQTKKWQAMGNVYAEIQIVEGLKFRSTFNSFFAYNDGTNWSPQLESAGGRTGNQTTFSKGTNSITNWQWDNILYYDNTFGAHHISLLGGVTSQENRYEFLNASGSHFLDENVRVINGSDIESRTVTGGIEEWSLLSYIGRLSYSFKDKYLFQANVRRDGSSRFSENNRWAVFPSFSLGWRLSEENFMQQLSGISNLKLRGSWGKLGNDQIGLYSYAATVNFNQRYTFGESQTPQVGATPTSLANTEIKWEETVQTNIGLDLGILDNKLQFVMDYFVKNTNDMLLRVPIPSSSGYSASPFVNAGSVQNKGWEFSAIYKNVSGNFNYDIALNLSGIKNEVTSLGQGQRIITGHNSGASNGNLIVDEGTEIFAFFGYVADGLYQNQAEIDAVDALNPEREYDPGAGPGAIRFKDIDGDGLITDADRIVIGSPYPDLTFGLNFNASYKGFDFTLFFQGVVGNDILQDNSDSYQMQPGSRLIYNLNRWFKEGDTNDPVLWGVNGFNNASSGRDGRTSSIQVFDGSYFRSKNIQIGYTLPETLTSKAGISRLRVYISTKNLFTIWNRDDYNLVNDPELGSEGVGFGMYNFTTTSQVKTYVVGLNISF